MGKVYDGFLKIKLKDGTKKDDALLIYILAARETEFSFSYSLEREAQYNQFWLYSHDVSIEGATVLLQVSQCANGRVLLSIQGLSNKFPEIKNFIDYGDPDEYDIFMDNLKLF